MIKYAVIIEPVSRHPWTEYMADSEQEAWDRRQFIEANLRGVRVKVEKVETRKEGE